MDKRAAAPCMVTCPADCPGGTANSCAPLIYVRGVSAPAAEAHPRSDLEGHSVENRAQAPNPDPRVSLGSLCDCKVVQN